jgi:hypothetical protein
MKEYIFNSGKSLKSLNPRLNSHIRTLVIRTSIKISYFNNLPVFPAIAPMLFLVVHHLVPRHASCDHSP